MYGGHFENSSQFCCERNLRWPYSQKCFLGCPLNECQISCLYHKMHNPLKKGHLSALLLVSEIAWIYDILEIVLPDDHQCEDSSTKCMRAWKDEPVPSKVETAWSRWRRELPALRDHLIHRRSFRNNDGVKFCELHCSCDASESAYAAVVYLRSKDQEDEVHKALIAAKTKVASIKRQLIPRLELCCALILARLLHHCATVLNVQMGSVYMRRRIAL